MILGFISLLLTFGQSYIARVCIPQKIADTMLPCESEVDESHGGRRRLWDQRRVLAAGSLAPSCKAVGWNKLPKWLIPCGFWIRANGRWCFETGVRTAYLGERAASAAYPDILLGGLPCGLQRSDDGPRPIEGVVKLLSCHTTRNKPKN